MAFGLDVGDVEPARLMIRLPISASPAIVKTSFPFAESFILYCPFPQNREANRSVLLMLVLSA